MHLENQNYTRIWKEIGIEEKDCVAHYTKVEHLDKILHDKKLLIGSVCEFDDPRESSMDWIGHVCLGHELDMVTQQAVIKIKCKAGRQLRLLCTVGFKKPKSPPSSLIEEGIYGRPRMWSQYGDRFKGFCIVLDKGALNKELQRIAIKEEYLISDKVDYNCWLSRIEGDGVKIEYWPGIDLGKLDIFEKMNENLKLKFLYFRKSKNWRDESEYRWLLFDPTEDRIFVPIENSIKAVVLGHRFPPCRIDDVKAYCKELCCPCYQLYYQHPQYKLGRV